MAERRPDLSAATAGMSLEEKISRLGPTPAEEAWRRIPWRRDLETAFRDAARAGKPVFLWLMDGDPLGCT